VGPYVVAARAREILEREASLGCTAELAPHPVQLEPPFRDLMEVAASHTLSDTSLTPLWIPGEEPAPQTSRRYQVWLPPEAGLAWTRAELFLRQLYPISHRLGLELAGNREGLQLSFLAHPQDSHILQAAFRAWYEDSELTPSSGTLWQGATLASRETILLRGYYPPPPYSHSFTCPEGLRLSPLGAVLAALMEIPPPTVGLYQLLFQPTSPDHDWHANVERLLDLEYAVKLLSGAHLAPSYAHYPQQSPSGDLHNMAQDVESKAHNDRPFYSVALRTAAIGSGEELSTCLEALSSPISIFQHGGHPLRFITEQDYLRILSREELGTMLVLGLTYRPGFLLNSRELSSLLHLPPGKALAERKAPIELLETLTIENSSLLSGTSIGTSSRAGLDQTVCIPGTIRSRSTHLIGRHGMGKSTLLEHMILHDLDRGHGVALLDPHGDLVQRLLCLIPEQHVERIIFFDPGDPDWVPLWNSLSLSPGQDISRTADDLVAGIKSIVYGWGDCLEHLLRHGFFALLHLPDSTLLDLSDLLRRKSEESDRLRKIIIESLDNLSAQGFWRDSFHRYDKAAFGPPQHKLSKLLVSGTTSLMLSQSENRIDLRNIMDTGQALLVDLSTVGLEAREILGSFLLSMAHTVALGRSALPTSQRHPFHIYCDEAHRFVSKDLEDLLVETRKFGVDLTLAHQYLRQFDAGERGALATVGATVIFNVDARDGRVLLKDLRGEVDVDDLIVLEVGEAVARIGTEIVRLKTFPPLDMPAQNYRDRVIHKSHE